MTLSKLFPKRKLDEVFNKFGFERKKPKDGILYMNHLDTVVNIYRHRFKKEVFLLTSNAFAPFGIKIDSYKREWSDNEVQDCINFIEKKLLPQINNLKGPYRIEPGYFFARVEKLFSKHISVKCDKGNKDFSIPFRSTEQVHNFDYLKIDIKNNITLFFLNTSKIYKILLIKDDNKEMLNWYDFADRDKEGDEFLTQMVENIAIFLKLKK